MTHRGLKGHLRHDRELLASVRGLTASLDGLDKRLAVLNRTTERVAKITRGWNAVVRHVTRRDRELSRLTAAREVIDRAGAAGIPRLAGGSEVRGPGGPREDRVIARLSAGEFVVNAAAAARHRAVLEAINRGDARLHGYAEGGVVVPAAKEPAPVKSAGNARGRSKHYPPLTISNEPVPQGGGNTDPSSLKGILYRGESGGNPGIYNHRVIKFIDGNNPKYRVVYQPNVFTHYEQLDIGGLEALGEAGFVFAAGKYQIVPQTLKAAIQALHLRADDNFTSDLQDRIYTDFLAGKARPALNAYVTGVSDDIDAAHIALAHEWVSIAYKHKSLGRLPNKASIDDDVALAALRHTRELYLRLRSENYDETTARRAALLGIEHPTNVQPQPPEASDRHTEVAPRPTSDVILGRLSPNKFMVDTSTTARHRTVLKAINRGDMRLPGYAAGGIVAASPEASGAGLAFRALAGNGRATRPLTGLLEGGEAYSPRLVLASYDAPGHDVLKYLANIRSSQIIKHESWSSRLPSVDRAFNISKQNPDDATVQSSGENEAHPAQFLQKFVSSTGRTLLIYPNNIFPDWMDSKSRRELAGINKPLARDLLAASEATGLHFHITQGLRTQAEANHNASTGRGVRNSQHLYGAAADIVMQDAQGRDIRDRAAYQRFADAFEAYSRRTGGHARWLGNLSGRWRSDIVHFDQGIGYGQTHKPDPFGTEAPTQEDIQKGNEEIFRSPDNPFLRRKFVPPELRPTLPMLGPGGIYANKGNDSFAIQQHAAERAVLPRMESPIAVAPFQLGAKSAGVDVQVSGLDDLREAHHHVDSLHRKLAGLGNVRIDVQHHGFSHQGDHAPGAVRTALNGNFGSDGRAFG